MLEQVSEVVQEQLKNKRDAILYGYNYERQLWAARDEPERRGSPNWDSLPMKNTHCSHSSRLFALELVTRLLRGGP